MTPEELKFAAEYHRGFEDGKAARSADEWQLDRERARIIRKLDALILNADVWNYYNLSAVCKAVYEPSFGWTIGACEALRDELVRLLGGVRETGETTTYDELGNERHKAICRLQRFVPMIGERPTDEASKLIQCITGNDGSRVACVNDLEETRDRLIHLLGGDQSHFPASIGHENETGNGTENGTCPNNVPIVSITSELRKFAETFRHEWYDEKDGSVCYTTSDMPPTIDSVNGADYINAIADRIDKKVEDLAHDVIMWRDRAEDMRMERDELQAELGKWKGLADTNAKALLQKVAEYNELRRKLDAVRGIVDGS